MTWAGKERARRDALGAVALALAAACGQDPSRQLGERLGLEAPRKVRSLVTGFEDTQRYFRFVAPPEAVEAAASRLGLRCLLQRESPEAPLPARIESWRWRGFLPAGSATVDWWHPERLREPILCTGEVLEEERWPARYRLAFERETGLAYLEIHSP